MILLPDVPGRPQFLLGVGLQIEVEFVVLAGFDVAAKRRCGVVFRRNLWRVAHDFWGNGDDNRVVADEGAWFAALVGELVATVGVGAAIGRPLRIIGLESDGGVGKRPAVERDAAADGRKLGSGWAASGK